MSKKKGKKKDQEEPKKIDRFIDKNQKSSFEKSATEFGVELKQATRALEISYCSRCGYENLPTDEKCFNCRSPLHIYTEEYSEIEGLEKAKKKLE
jgi:hypothetical protein